MALEGRGHGRVRNGRMHCFGKDLPCSLLNKKPVGRKQARVRHPLQKTTVSGHTSNDKTLNIMYFPGPSKLKAEYM